MTSKEESAANSRLATIRVGTSGYSFADWVGNFYPHYTQQGKMLDYYVTRFPTVEINSTYYRVPHPAVMRNLARKAPDAFDFMVKVPQSFTHRRADFESDITRFIDSIQPIAESGKLAGCLAQFPYSFRQSPVALEHVIRCREAVAPHQLFVEYRHDSWSRRDILLRMASEKLGYVSVDEPELPGLMDRELHATIDTAYVRMHGRNAAGWWVSGEERYNYLYSDEELDDLRKRIERIRNKVKQVYVYFNNCYDGKAAANALSFMQRLETGS